jgi:lipid-binding SYLF domain-containing protein
MMLKIRFVTSLLTLALVTTPSMGVRPAHAASAAAIDRDASAALAALYEKVPDAKRFAAKAKGILVFPSIAKAGFLWGAQYGEGALRKGNRTVGYYNTIAASYGLQAGVQSFGYAMFFMSDSALAYLEKSGGLEVGSGPSVVVVDEGAAKSATTMTMQSDVYAFAFSQKGLMAGLGLQGSKISKIDK